MCCLARVCLVWPAFNTWVHTLLLAHTQKTPRSGPQEFPFHFFNQCKTKISTVKWAWYSERHESQVIHSWLIFSTGYWADRNLNDYLSVIHFACGSERSFIKSQLQIYFLIQIADLQTDQNSHLKADVFTDFASGRQCLKCINFTQSFKTLYKQNWKIFYCWKVWTQAILPVSGGEIAETTEAVRKVQINCFPTSVK